MENLRCRNLSTFLSSDGYSVDVDESQLGDSTGEWNHCHQTIRRSKTRLQVQATPGKREPGLHD
jgi:hypothetical protein